MEYLIKCHDPNYLFVGSRPTDTEPYYNKFLAVMGMSVKQFTKNPNSKGRRKTTSRELAKGARYLRQNIIASHTLSWRYFCHGANIDLEIEPSLMTILIAFAWKPTTALVRVQELRFPTSVQLLASLRHGLNMETERILFDYFSMHRRCFNLDSELHRVLKKNLKLTGEILGQNHIDPDYARQVPASILQMLTLPVDNNPIAKLQLYGMLYKTAPAIDALIKKERDHETKRMTSAVVDMADLTNDLKGRKYPDARASDLAGAGSGSMDIIDAMKRMSIAEGNHPDDFDDDLAQQFINESSNHSAVNPTMKDSEGNGVREMNELLVSMGMKPHAKEMLRKDPMGLMKLILGEENGGAGKIRPLVDEADEDTREKKQKKNKARNVKRKAKGLRRLGPRTTVLGHSSLHGPTWVNTLSLHVQRIQPNALRVTLR